MTTDWRDEDNFGPYYRGYARHVLTNHGVNARWLAIYIRCDNVIPELIEINQFDFWPWDVSGQDQSFDVLPTHVSVIKFKRSYDSNYYYNGVKMSPEDIGEKISTDYNIHGIDVHIPNSLLNDGVIWTMGVTTSKTPTTSLDTVVNAYNKAEKNFYDDCMNCELPTLDFKLICEVAGELYHIAAGKNISIRDAIISLVGWDKQKVVGDLLAFCRGVLNVKIVGKEEFVDYLQLLGKVNLLSDGNGKIPLVGDQTIPEPRPYRVVDVSQVPDVSEDVILLDEM